MAKSRQLKQVRRLRFDKSMLFIGLCSLLGGYLVFTSYAAQHPATTKPGTVSVSALPKNGIYYRFPIKAGLKYCFEAPQKYAKLKVYEDQVLKESYNIESGCFEAKKSYQDPIISITGISADSQLTISKQ